MNMKGKGKKKTGVSGEYVKEQILSILSQNQKHNFNYKQISQAAKYQ